LRREYPSRDAWPGTTNLNLPPRIHGLLEPPYSSKITLRHSCRLGFSSDVRPGFGGALAVSEIAGLGRRKKAGE
jgi:hypothetical protein